MTYALLQPGHHILTAWEEAGLTWRCRLAAGPQRCRLHAAAAHEAEGTLVAGEGGHAGQQVLRPRMLHEVEPHLGQLRLLHSSLHNNKNLGRRRQGADLG